MPEMKHQTEQRFVDLANEIKRASLFALVPEDKVELVAYDAKIVMASTTDSFHTVVKFELKNGETNLIFKDKRLYDVNFHLHNTTPEDSNTWTDEEVWLDYHVRSFIDQFKQRTFASGLRSYIAFSQGKG